MKRFQELTKATRILLIVVALFVAGFVLPFLSWLVGEESFTATSYAEFCVSCHTMEPFGYSNADSLHGGNNAVGFSATCTDCHLPHDNSAVYFYQKARTGLHDVFVQTFTDTSQIDWRAKTEYRDEFVYDSGCLSCHSQLETATQDTEEHVRYFNGTTESTCVSCHAEVGHKNLNKYLLQSKYSR